VYEWVDHTSELELRVHAGTPEEVVIDATAALGELLGDPDGAPSARALEVVAPDRAGLLAAWLEELVFVAESEALLAESARGVELAADRLRGEVLVRPGRPSYLVKAVTYHRLAFEAGAAGCSGRVVLDV
jgi:SHS2 domain-containing protein